MKLKSIYILNEDFKKNRREILRVLDLLATTKRNVKNKEDKKRLEKAIKQLSAVHKDIPKGNIDYLKKVFARIIKLPLRIFT